MTSPEQKATFLTEKKNNFCAWVEGVVRQKGLLSKEMTSALSEARARSAAQFLTFIIDELLPRKANLGGYFTKCVNDWGLPANAFSEGEKGRFLSYLQCFIDCIV